MGFRFRSHSRPSGVVGHSQPLQLSLGPDRFSFVPSSRRQVPSRAPAGIAADGARPWRGRPPSAAPTRARARGPAGGPQRRCRRASPRGSPGAGRRSSGHHLVELGAGAPDALADERPPCALREPLDERHRGDAVDDVVEGVVHLHPVVEERVVAVAGAPRSRDQVDGERGEAPLDARRARRGPPG